MTATRVLRLLRVSRTVTNLAEAVAFYCGALDFHVVAKAPFGGDAWSALMGVANGHGTSVTVRLGGQDVELVAFDPPGHPYPPASRSVDLWFQHIAIVVSDIHAAYAKLGSHPFKPISAHGPERLPPADGSVQAYKFRDPDGHPLELLQFPPTAGHPARTPDAPIFLGIDHSAINVADIRQSILFYTHTLGFHVSSRSINSGVAQQALDDASGDRVEVISMQPAVTGPPHVELLGYQTPVGQPMPPRMNVNDVAADRLVLEVDNLMSLVETFHAENLETVSPGIVAPPGGQPGVLARDPTGHFLLFQT